MSSKLNRQQRILEEIGIRVDKLDYEHLETLWVVVNVKMQLENENKVTTV